MIYLDSSALLKLVREEHESAALEHWLSAREEMPTVSSELAKIEVLRACRRLSAEALPKARVLVASLDLIPITSDLVEHATEIGEPALRSLDAINLVSALSIREELSAFVVYDRRLYDAAAAQALEPLRPGA
ncbi:MAG: type II toxin-antitoxin system VapC family toxin [Streptosporangiaceae bacterium]